MTPWREPCLSGTRAQYVLGLARTVYTQCSHGAFGLEITKYMVCTHIYKVLANLKYIASYRIARKTWQHDQESGVGYTTASRVMGDMMISVDVVSLPLHIWARK